MDVIFEAFDGMRDAVERFGGAKAEFVTLTEEFIAARSGQEYIIKVLEPSAE